MDNEGQICTLFWLFTLDTCNTSEAVFNTLVDRAKRRGETVRQRCGPRGNLIETLLEQSRSIGGRTKLLLVRKHYQSMSWPFEYDPREIEEDGWGFLTDGPVRSLSSVLEEPEWSEYKIDYE